MRWTYDSTVAGLYVYLREAAVDHQIELRSNVIVDVDAADMPVGIELLFPGTIIRSSADVEDFATALEKVGLSADDARMVTMLCFFQFPGNAALSQRQPEQQSAPLELQRA